MRLKIDGVASAIFVLVLLLAFVQLASNAITLDTWMDEGKYLMKGYWYVTDRIPSYSAIDPTYYMPLIFYVDGLMQWIFGIGYMSGRIAMTAFSIGCLVLVYLAGQNIGRSRLAGLAAVILVAAHSVTLTYFATATPYAMVSFLSVLVIYILLAAQSRAWAFSAAGLVLWALIFARPDMLPFAMVPAGWALFIEPKHKLLSLSLIFVAFMVPSVLTVLAFGPRLLDVVLDVPGLSQVATLLGVPPAPISGVLPLTISPLDPVVHFWEVPSLFFHHFLKPYLTVAVVTAAMTAVRINGIVRKSSERYLKPIDLIVGYFWATVFIHFFLSLSYCVDCITPYTNYFLPVGALAAATLVGTILETFPGNRPSFVTLSCTLVLGLVIHALPAFPTLLRPASVRVRDTAETLAAQLKSILPRDRRVFVLSGSVAPAQAVWLAGGVIEPRSMYLPTNFRQPRPDLPEGERGMVDSIIWKAGFWSEASLRRALAHDYSVLLVERSNAYEDPMRLVIENGIPFGNTVQRYYRLITTARTDHSTLELYQRTK